MHILQLSQRNAQAQRRLLDVAERFAYYAELDPSLIAALKPKSKDKDVRILQEREAIADLLEAIATRLDLPAKPSAEDVTAVTDEDINAVQHQAKQRSSTMDTIFEKVDESQALVSAILPDDLPAPVLEEAQTGEAIDLPLEEVPADQPLIEEGPAVAEEVVEEVPAEKPARSSKKSKAKK